MEICSLEKCTREQGIEGEYKQEEGYEVCMGCCTKGGSSGAVCVEKMVDVNSIHCATCGYWVHGQCLGV